MAEEVAAGPQAQNALLFNQFFQNLEHALMGEAEVLPGQDPLVDQLVQNADDANEGAGVEPHAQDPLVDQLVQNADDAHEGAGVEPHAQDPLVDQLVQNADDAHEGAGVEPHAQGNDHALQGDDNVIVPAVQNLFDLGIQHLRNLNEPRLRGIINENPQLPVFNVQDMTLFQKLTRALIEEGGRNEERPTIYQNLVLACNGQVNPATVGGLVHQVLVDMRVGGQLKAEVIVNFAQSFADENELDELPQLESQAIFQRFKTIRGIGGYRALYVLLFGAGRMDYMPITELTLREKLQRLYGNHKPNYDTWNPYKGLASWFIWKYISRW